MQYGICPLSLIPIRLTPDHTGTMNSQLLFGDHYKILEHRKHWSRIRVADDNCEGWVSNNQIHFIAENEFKSIDNSKKRSYSLDLVSFVNSEQRILMPIVLGSCVNIKGILPHTFEGNSTMAVQNKAKLIETALLYLNAPYLHGGKSPFGIDSAAFTQMVYKINGFNLLRNADEQATQGHALSFIEESETGDLAFFDNDEGVIDHVGLIMPNNYIVHANEKVRIDRLDHTGIFNTDLGNYTHKLRVIKKIA